MQEKRLPFSGFPMIFSGFYETVPGNRAPAQGLWTLCRRVRVFIFKRFILTIAQASDRINSFLQLFLRKLRTRPFVRTTFAQFETFWLLPTICHFRMAFARDFPAKRWNSTPISRPPIRDNCASQRAFPGQHVSFLPFPIRCVCNRAGSILHFAGWRASSFTFFPV